ncbi:helix-turn-helix transcriptional regulator [Streptomyces sp. NPDC045251]|uniref:helix-turn-helix domain-containing protein n=1 Tax=unclassified Streptomyces TaxID=2593676 RepID=UPI0033C7DF51
MSSTQLSLTRSFHVPSGRPGYGDQLSPREQEVAGLVVQGRANHDIAESLVLSTRHVEHHVARIMRRFNVGSRTDIAAAGDDGFRLRTRPATRHGAGNPYPSL